MVKKSIAALCSFVLLLSVFAMQPLSADANSKADGIIAEAKKHMGTPYSYGGTTPSGFDCSGFIGYVFEKEGVDLPRTASQQYNVGDSVSKSNLKKGDLVFFSGNGSSITHNGIYIGNGKFIHSASSKGVSISKVDDPYYWGSRYAGAKRVLEDETEAVKSETLEPLPQGEFHDVDEDFWAYGSITTLAKDGIIRGYENSTFKPSKALTRAQAASLLARALDLPQEGTDTGFNDVSSSNVHAAAIKAVKEAGLLNGNSDGEFMPSEPMKRQHMAVVFHAAFDLEGVEYDGEFVDVGSDHPYYEHIQAVAGSGIANGNADGEFQPNRETTRAHFSVFMDNALND
ncbi:S-layer homology domain-containing protein [Alteribacillus persepolensis]|uniref:S-layer homology domain-containing protein n=1 Tax=Alteribacillus persepolensis TaxID=568899 RepID=A0A1G8H951_9BACI|nr:C40 family peptidase [Alteribacillus persepolensis]SDI03061.1 S-layer homology domain-containing protein [Alteribacillus persepolensis]